MINDVNDVSALERFLQEKQTSFSEDHVIYIHEIAMHPDFRGRGLTQPLIDFTEKLARKNGFKWMSLVSLGPALGFWKKAGYKVVRELDYEGHTCYYMEKAL
jgi:ribosomal protein S18 acetylase RimI-like enzyme